MNMKNKTVEKSHPKPIVKSKLKKETRRFEKIYIYQNKHIPESIIKKIFDGKSG